MSVTTIKIGTAGRGQIPHDVGQNLGIMEGDTLVVEIKEVLKCTTFRDKNGRQNREKGASQ